MLSRHRHLIALLLTTCVALVLCWRHWLEVHAQASPTRASLTVASERLLDRLLGPGRSTAWLYLSEGQVHAVVTVDAKPEDPALSSLRPSLESLLCLDQANGDRLELIPVPGHRGHTLGQQLRAANLALLVTTVLTLAALTLCAAGEQRLPWRAIAWGARIAFGVLMLGLPLWRAAGVPHLGLLAGILVLVGRPWRLPPVERSRTLLALAVAGTVGVTWLLLRPTPANSEQALRRELSSQLSAQWVLLNPRPTLAGGTIWGGVAAVGLNPADPCATQRLATLQASVRQAHPDLRLSLVGVSGQPPRRIPWILLSLLAGLTLAAAWRRPRRTLRTARTELQTLCWPTLLAIDPVAVELGSDLRGLVDPAGAESVRSHMARELGIKVPAVSFRDNLTLAGNEWRILLRDVEVGRGSRDGLMARLTEVVRSHAEQFAGLDETADLLNTLHQIGCVNLVRSVRARFELETLSAVLRGLLRERISVRDLKTIFEAMLDCPRGCDDLEVLLAASRQALARRAGKELQA